ncbi:hypothetical protein AgCh_038434 [Apium graveolens]
MKVAVSFAGEPEKMIDKDRKDYFPEDISSIMKDAKVRHIMHNSLDSVMSNRVIGRMTTKKIWDVLEVKYQGITVIKKNMRTILTQEYEYFDSKDNVSLTEIYDRFQKLMNDLSLADKEYDLENSNLKFLLVLPEKWDYKVTSIRDNYQLDITPLDEIYGVLKSYELEMEQRSKIKGSKARPVALKVEEKSKEKARRKSYSKGKTMIAKSNTESSNTDDDSNTDTESDADSDHNNNEDMEQMDALLVKSFKKMVYKNFNKGRRFFRKGFSSSNSDKRNNRRNTDGKESRSGKLDKSKERCYNCDEIRHFAADCRKNGAGKKQALISRKINWDDSSDSDDGVNYALMEKADAESDNAELKEILENGCWGSGLGYSARSNSDKKSGKKTEITEPIKTDSKFKLNKKQLTQKLKDLHMKYKNKRSRKNRNEKIGILERRSVAAGDQPRSNTDMPKHIQLNKRGTKANIGLARVTGECSSLGQWMLMNMTGYKSLLSKFEEKVGPNVSYGDGNLEKISGYDKIKVGNVIIENIALVAGLKHNLISVSQICDRGYHVNFDKEHCEIVSKSDGKITRTGTGIKDFITRTSTI